jgi:hypothetical protein
MVQPKISRGLRSLPAAASKGSSSSPSEEMNQLKSEVAQIEQWWSDSHRWQHTTRPYSGKCVLEAATLLVTILAMHFSILISQLVS